MTSDKTALDLALSECEKLKELCEQRQQLINEQRKTITDQSREIWILKHDRSFIRNMERV